MSGPDSDCFFFFRVSEKRAVRTYRHQWLNPSSCRRSDLCFLRPFKCEMKILSSGKQYNGELAMKFWINISWILPTIYAVNTRMYVRETVKLFEKEKIFRSNKHQFPKSERMKMSSTRTFSLQKKTGWKMSTCYTSILNVRSIGPIETAKGKIRLEYVYRFFFLENACVSITGFRSKKSDPIKMVAR